MIKDLYRGAHIPGSSRLYKEKADAYRSDRRPPEGTCFIPYALRKVSSSAQGACTHLTEVSLAAMCTRQW